MTKSSKKSSEKTKRPDSELLAEISHKLDMVVAGIASQNKDSNSQVERLSDRFEPMEMADILGATPNAIRIRLFELRKSKGGKKARKKKS
jgi:uncharacterized protein YfkK (UPF0435 family)